MNMTTKKIARLAILLALAIASQFMKNLSVYITGPIINAILILATLSCGLGGGVILSVITPLTSWLITGSPVMSAMPAIIPCVMLGNFVICLFVYLFTKNKENKVQLILGEIVGSAAKAVCMYLTIAVGVIQIFGPSSGLPDKALVVAKTTFSITQLITALIGSVLAYLIWIPLKKAIKNNKW